MTNGSNEYHVGGFRILPPVVKNLLIINGLFFLATIGLGSAFNIDLIDKLGLHFVTSEKFHFYQIFTYLFMHGGLSHIFFNMFALWMFGSALENYWGGKRFLVYYLITGVGAGILHYLVFYFEAMPTLHAINAFLVDPSVEAYRGLLNSGKLPIVSNEIMNSYNIMRGDFNATVGSNPNEALQIGIDYIRQYRIDFLNTPVVVGASGAIYGLLLAFGMLFPNAMIYVYFLIPIKAKWFVIIYGVLELISGITSTGDGIAHFAHLGGMIFGFLLIKYWQKRDRQRSHNYWG